MAKREPKGAMEIAYQQSLKADAALGFTTQTEEEKNMTNVAEAAVKNNEVVVENNGELAVVKLLPNGRVEVERDGNVTAFGVQHTFDSVVQNFLKEGWELHTASRTVKVAVDQGVPVSIQEEVDEYLALHEEQSKLKAKLEAKKKAIKAHMDHEGLKAIKGTDGKEVYLQDATASNSTSRYTDYLLNDIQPVLEGSLLRTVTEIVVNADKLNGLLKMGKLPKEKVEEIKALKISIEGTPRFAVRK